MRQTMKTMENTVEKFDLTEYENIPFFTLQEIAGKERNLVKRKALFDLSNKLLDRVFVPLAEQSRKKSVPQ